MFKGNTKICILDAGCAGGIDPFFNDLIINSDSYAYGFDANIEEINKLINTNENPNINYYNFLISNKIDKEKFYKHETVGSIFENELKKKSYKNKYKEILIDSITLDKFVINKNIKDIIILKVDIEGSEVNLLDGAVKILEDLVVCVKIEFNLHSPARTNNFSEIHKKMIDNNFQLMNICLDEGNIFGIHSGDALYLKKPTKLILNNLYKKDKLLNYINLLLFLNKREFAYLVLENSKKYFNNIDYQNLKKIINNKIFLNNILNFSFPKISMLFFYLSMFFAGNKYKSKSFPKINRLKQSNIFFKKIYTQTKLDRYMNKVNKDIERYNTFIENDNNISDK